ncbi:MAG: sialate O-acetylesterase [Paramuribaculum sp.]|nr:sialate O-acetylesterase [Paramuribaculum sp.]
MKLVYKTFGYLILSLFALSSVASPKTQKKNPKKDKITKVACIGNSITYGMLVDDREKNNYPAQLGQLLGDKYEVGNFGKSGATLLRKGHRPYNEQEEYAAAINFAPDIAVIHLGINDTDPRDWPDSGDFFVEDYVALIDSLKAVNPNVRVILANLSPLLSSHRRYKSGTRIWRDFIREAIPVVAELTGSELIDFGDALRDRPNLLPDGIHPNIEGAEILANTVYGAITGDYGGLSVPEVYGDRMVLQRNQPLVINGTANAGANVTVSIGGNSSMATADNRGAWSVTLPPMKEATGLEMTISNGKEKLQFQDVAIGEVWIASGQSNMEFQMRNTTTFNADKEILNDSLLRFFDMKPVALTNPPEWSDEKKQLTDRLMHYLPSHWEESTASDAGKYSAVAWYFGKMLRDSLNVPVGIISNAIGGSPAESWIDIETLEHGMPEILANWHNNDYLQPWVQKRALENIGKPEPQQKPSHRHPYEPAYLFAAGIRPLGAYPIAGAIWYQGESNAHNVELHEQLFPLLVESWRENWNNSELPFLFVQLSSINRPSWPTFRNSQRLLANSLPGVEMAVSMDHGDSLDVHPRNKRPIGERLGRQALNHVYGFSNVVPQGPTIVKAEKTAPGTVVLTFDYSEGLTTSDGELPRTFEVAQYDGLYVPVESVEIINGNTLKLINNSIENPKFVRYGWQPFTRANLVNGEGLPTSTFKVEIK